MIRNTQLAILLALLLLVCPKSFGFTLPVSTVHHASLSTTRLRMATVSVRTPSQEDAEQMGIREWPQQAKSKGTFEESCTEGNSLTRYVLDGTCSVEVTSEEDDDDKEQFSLSPGSLLEVTGPANLRWQVTSPEMILLTPGFEQLGLFAGVAVGLVVLLGALIALS
ncbi:expressed unknown protein [Seminavis robusta]|uniref:Uncharacterized protein n=1 Tax=Seminavis robusta TaxID=568900 RepID=A0A9N8DYK4_9STRA|nr:expressed unknown protein [Seminavis robusta]|eukprot:Sro468_g149110.1 n/a (166) ;mRNA; f:25421-25918